MLLPDSSMVWSDSSCWIDGNNTEIGLWPSWLKAGAVIMATSSNNLRQRPGLNSCRSGLSPTIRLKPDLHFTVGISFNRRATLHYWYLFRNPFALNLSKCVWIFVHADLDPLWVHEEIGNNKTWSVLLKQLRIFERREDTCIRAIHQRRHIQDAAKSIIAGD